MSVCSTLRVELFLFFNIYTVTANANLSISNDPTTGSVLAMDPFLVKKYLQNYKLTLSKTLKHEVLTISQDEMY